MVTRREKEMDDVKNRRGRRVATSDRERDERSKIDTYEMRMKRGNTNGDGQRETNGDRQRQRWTCRWRDGKFLGIEARRGTHYLLEAGHVGPSYTRSPTHTCHRHKEDQFLVQSGSTVFQEIEIEMEILKVGIYCDLEGRKINFPNSKTLVSRPTEKRVTQKKRKPKQTQANKKNKKQKNQKSTKIKKKKKKNSEGKTRP